MMNYERLLQIIVAPRITEKSNLVSKGACKKIVFEVKKDANKLEIKEAVEKLFGVKVEKVSTMNYRGKNCRFRQRPGKHSDWKKAYVCLQSGQDINFGGLE
jgi:large subunit ribosomal protein L23